MPSHRAPGPDESRPDPEPVEAPDISVETREIQLPPPPLRSSDPPLAQEEPPPLQRPRQPVDTDAEPIDWSKRPRRPAKPVGRPEPVLNAARLAGAIAAGILALGGLLRLIGVIDLGSDDLQKIADAVSNVVLAAGALWATLGPWLTAWSRARDLVTPLADPRDSDGRPLVPMSREP